MEWGHGYEHAGCDDWTLSLQFNYFGMFSKSCEHGIKAMIYIATRSMEGKRVKIGDIIAHVGSPEAFTAKILGSLSKNQLLHSFTGPNGGFEMDAAQLKNVRLSQIVEAIDGDAIFNGCALGLSECNHESPCPLHHRFVKVRDDLKRMLERTTVSDLATGLKEGRSILLR
jgi:Rrf2 family transcriptional regulator, iron-sulfur cluster assembly transcription factor